MPGFILLRQARCAGDEIQVGSEEVQEVCSYKGLDMDSNPQQFLTVISKCDAEDCTELIRARTTWV